MNLFGISVRNRLKTLSTIPMRSLRCGTFFMSSLDTGQYESDQTVSLHEMRQFQKYSGEWWRPGGAYDALRELNKLRVPLVKQLCGRNITPLSMLPLEGMNILDVGSGGGILSEPLARLGANVVGIDPLQENITAAELHAERDPAIKTLSYQCTNIETLSSTQPGHFDVVIASEVLEHVDSPDVFVQSCCDALKPGGQILLTTINRTVLSTLLVKYVAEYVLKIVPQNTHDENKFVTPYEVIDFLRNADMTNIELKGMSFNFLTNKWSWSSSHLMNYACHARKPPNKD